MLGKIWNYFSGNQSSASISEDSPSLQGNLYIKELGKKIQQLSEECSISLTIKDEKKFDYVLNIVNDDKSQWDRMQFAINVDSQFKTFINNFGNKCIMWQKGLTFYFLELFNDEEICKNEPIFYDVLSTFITSNDFKISLNEACKEETRTQYVIDHGQINDVDKFLEENFKKIKIKKEENELVDQMNDLSLNKINKTDFKKNYQKYKELCEYLGTSFKYNQSQKCLEKIDDGDSVLKIIDIGNFEYLLVLEDKDCILTYTTVDSLSSIWVDENLITVSFLTHKNNVFVGYKFGLEDKTPSKISKLSNLVNKCLYEATNKTSYDKMSKEAQEYLDFEGMYEEEDDSTISVEKKLYDFDTKYHEAGSNANNSVNKLFTQAFKFNRAFVIKEDNTVDVFKTENDTDDQLVYKNSLTPFKNDNNINLSDVKMYNGDNQMLFHDSKTPDSLWQYDLNKEEVVQEWKCGENAAPILDFTQSTKLGQLENNCDIIGVTKKKLFSMDGRVNRKNKVVEDKIYNTSPNFQCVATPGFDSVATGSANGDIRLFNAVGKNAKTLIPCFGDPIRYLDVTKSGDYILATCDKYIMLVNTLGNNNENGFTACLKRAKKKPKTLKLTPFDLIKYGLQNDCYTPAKFNLSKSDKETHITSSLGNYIIVWNFEDVKKGIVDSYKLTNVNEYVIRSITKFDKNQLLVTMPNKVRLQNEKITEV